MYQTIDEKKILCYFYDKKYLIYDKKIKKINSNYEANNKINFIF